MSRQYSGGCYTAWNKGNKSLLSQWMKMVVTVEKKKKNEA